MQLVTSKDNLGIKNTAKLIKSSKHRKTTGLFVAEGLRICIDAMLSKAPIKTLYVTEKAAEKHPDDFSKLEKYAENIVMVSPSVFSYISDTENPQGFLCIIKALDKTSHFDTIKNDSKFLALDNLQDPNNLGTILRTAEAFNINGVILSEDCCDIYSPKVVRGSMGAVFRIPFCVCNSICDFISNKPELNSYAAVVDSKAEKITQTSFNTPCVTAIGNEGNGLKPETVAACKTHITIPMDGKAESLNASVAASIIMWELVK